MPELFPYQIDGAKHLARQEKAFLFDDMGVGKTAQAVTACDFAARRPIIYGHSRCGVAEQKILVICPAVAVLNWKREFEKWQAYPRAISCIDGPKTKFSDVTIMSYDRASKKPMHNRIRAWQPDIVILDEAHYLKNPDAVRTASIFGYYCDGEDAIIESAKYVWALTGTPTPNHPGEIWTMFNAMRPELINCPDYWDFVRAYCTVRPTDWGLQVTGINAFKVEQLKKQIAPAVLRRSRDHVLPDLRITNYPLQLTKKDTQELSQLESLPECRRLREALETGQRYDSLMDGSSGELSRWLNLLGMIKARETAKLVQMELGGNDRKVIIFGRHTEALKALKLQCTYFGYNPVMILGETPMKDRQHAIDAFQNNQTCRVFIGNIQAAGTAITLTAASDVLIMEPSWTPGDNDQAIKRAHRTGQLHSVWARYLYMENSMDELLMRVTARKTKFTGAMWEAERAG